VDRAFYDADLNLINLDHQVFGSQCLDRYINPKAPKMSEVIHILGRLREELSLSDGFNLSLKKNQLTGDEDLKLLKDLCETGWIKTLEITISSSLANIQKRCCCQSSRM
jgi:hypothetical protein